jgi:hypothetical protein
LAAKFALQVMSFITLPLLTLCLFGLAAALLFDPDLRQQMTEMKSFLASFSILALLAGGVVWRLRKYMDDKSLTWSQGMARFLAEEPLLLFAAWAFMVVTLSTVTYLAPVHFLKVTVAAETGRPLPSLHAWQLLETGLSDLEGAGSAGSSTTVFASERLFRYGDRASIRVTAAGFDTVARSVDIRPAFAPLAFFTGVRVPLSLPRDSTLLKVVARSRGAAIRLETTGGLVKHARDSGDFTLATNDSVKVTITDRYDCQTDTFTVWLTQDQVIRRDVPRCTSDLVLVAHSQGGEPVAGLAVQLNGQPQLGVVPLELTVDAGQHQVWIDRDMNGSWYYPRGLLPERGALLRVEIPPDSSCSLTVTLERGSTRPDSPPVLDVVSGTEDGLHALTCRERGNE